MGIVAVALVAAIGTLLFGRYDPGIRLEARGDRVVVADVTRHSLAYLYGVRPGMVVLRLNGATLLRLPQPVYSSVEPTPDPETYEVPEREMLGIEPAVPTPVVFGSVALAELLAPPVRELEAIEPWALEQGTVASGWNTVSIWDDGRSGLRDASPALFLGALLLLLAGWWLASGRAGGTMRPLAVPLAVAAATPFLVQPLDATWSPWLIAVGGLLAVAGMVPLALALLDRIDDPEERRTVAILTAGVVIVAATVAVGLTAMEPRSGTGFASWALTGAVPLVAGLAAAGPVAAGGVLNGSPTSGRLLQSTEFAVAGVTPMVALATDQPPYLFPFGLWVVLVLVAGRFTIRPLARLATRAQLQRDLVVAATEAERARVAADIHDDALQELTLLVGRLDAAGDAEGAEIARTVSDRLRAICGDLRLPILDDLGVGPALDWLVLRIERLAGGEVRLERADGARPPPEVELAFFRIAQEALANAVKHGRPPIVVRYAATPSGASLSIDDAGPGIDPGAPAEAEQAGRFGLLNMAQRAEAIGAILDVRRWPAGGTHVALDWRPR
jgi:signal transduction histidine kinase